MGFQHAWNVLTGIEAVNNRHRAEMDVQHREIDHKNKLLEQRDKELDINKENTEKTLKNDQEKHLRELEQEKYENDEKRKMEQEFHQRQMIDKDNQRQADSQKHIQELHYEREQNQAKIKEEREKYKEALQSQERNHARSIEFEHKKYTQQIEFEREKHKEGIRIKDRTLDLEWARIEQHALENGNNNKKERIMQIQETIQTLRDMITGTDGDLKITLQNKIMHFMDKIDKIHDEQVKIPGPTWQQITEEN